MFVLRASSPVKLRPPVPELKEFPSTKEEAAPISSEPFIDRGLPIPETYDVNIIRALLQDPFRILIYWEVREESLRALTGNFTKDDSLQVTLKLSELEGGYEAFFEVGARGRYWMLVFPGREYEFEIGVRSPEHGYIALVRSNRVSTPRGTVSPEQAEDAQYRLSSSEFVDILNVTGFGAEEMLSVITAAASRESRELDSWAAWLLKLPESIRKALITISGGGELTLDQLDDLPEPLRSELLKLLSAGAGRLASAAFMHYLPELLHEAVRDEQGWIGDHIHPLRLSQRFMLGGTENVALPGGEIRWPSLSRWSSSF